MAFAGFLRADELLDLRPCDIEINTAMAKLHVCRSKTDQLRKRDEVLIARSATTTCPVSVLERYMAKASIPVDSQLFLFRAITKTKGGEILRATGALSYSRLNELFK